MAITDADKFVDQIYEASVVPTLWPQLIGNISDALGGVGAFLFAVRPDGYVGAVSSPSVADIGERFIKEGWSVRDPRLPRALKLNHPGFINDGDLFTPAEIAADEVYEQFHRKNGIGYMAGTIIPNPSGDMISFAFQRHQDRGPVPRDVVEYLDLLRPHLARASMLSFRLGFERARVQADALQALGLPGAVLRGRGQIIAANALFESLMPDTVQDRQERILLTDTAADRLLALALDAISVSHSRAVSSIPITASAQRLAMILHVVPLRRAAHDIFSGASALVVVTPVDRAAVPTAEVLQGLFDLSPAEARVARGIAEAQTVEALAAAIGVSRETVRSHLKRVLAKTGQGRQVELANLLSGLTFPSSARPAATRSPPTRRR
jgi:DNA-binding CsgD family transcriptional regulator